MNKLLLAAVLCTMPVLAETIQDVAWMAGSWSGVMGRTTVEEHWIKPAGKAMLSVGRVVSGDRMVLFEYLRIIERDGGLVYIAQPKGAPPTEFKATSVKPNEVVFENPQHDNPKKILYRLEPDGTLYAETSGDERGKPARQEFRYKKLN